MGRCLLSYSDLLHSTVMELAGRCLAGVVVRVAVEGRAHVLLLLAAATAADGWADQSGVRVCCCYCWHRMPIVADRAVGYCWLQQCSTMREVTLPYCCPSSTHRRSRR